MPDGPVCSPDDPTDHGEVIATSSGADYPAAKWVPADPSNYRHGGPDMRPIECIVTHITSGHDKAENTAAMWQKPGGDDGKTHTTAHFVIGQDGTVIQAVRLADIAQHAHAASATSVGIEHCAREPGAFNKTDPGLPLSEAQIAASVRLVAWLCQRFNLPVDRAHIMGHAEADRATTHTLCCAGVAGGWPWGDYIAAVQRAGSGVA